MPGGIPRFLLRAPHRNDSQSETVELPKPLFDAMMAVINAASNHATAYLEPAESPGVWEVGAHNTRLAMFAAIRELNEVNP